MKVWMLFFLLLPLNAIAFTHIKLTPEFENYITRNKTKSNATPTAQKSSLKSMSMALTEITDPERDQALKTRMINALLGTSAGPIPVDGEGSPLYEVIRNNLQSAHEQLGKQEVANLDRLNQQFNLGTSNFSGFSWQKPFGVVRVHVDRQVTPPLYNDMWMVRDTFTIAFEATTFLEKLNEAGLSTMSATEIGAFAGITFQRVYTYDHFAKTYRDGLQSDFSKLFLSFLKFNVSGMESMLPDEALKREDIWTMKAGGLITTPPLYNVTFSAGVLAEHDFQQTSVMRNYSGTDASLPKYGIDVESKKATTVGVTTELQLDFFNLLKFSLLHADVEYEYASGKKYKLDFTASQWQGVKSRPNDVEEFKQLLKGAAIVTKLEPYVVRLEDSDSTSVAARGSILIWGKMQKTKTEHLRTISEQNVRLWFKNYSQSVKVVQNFLSRIFSAVIYKLLKFPIGATNAAIYSRQITMEWEATHPQSTDMKIMRVDGSEKFSFVISQYYQAARTDRWVDKRFRNDVVWFVDNFTTLPKSYKKLFESEELKGPLKVESNLRVEKAGFDYMIATNMNDIFKQLAKVCKSKKKDDWSNEARRPVMLKESQSGAEDCVKDLGLNFLSFKTDYLNNLAKPSLNKFKDFLSKYYKKSQNLASIQALFGEDNTFIDGTLRARSKNNIDYNYPFSDGHFRGLGVIDNFLRGTGPRAPASIVGE